jgi:serine/threonine-protein kinase
MDQSLSSQLQAALGANFEIRRELGGGGMSRVFVAHETRLNREVVIKVLPPDLAAGIKTERFEREIQFAARLQHPHIVPLLSAGAQDGLLYYTMPFVHGPSLAARLQDAEALKLADAVAIFRDVADALTYAHTEGVVHRDIKPQNILLQGHHAVVLDFGVAKAVTEAVSDASLTSTGLTLGTPLYMAPEQALADPHIDGRADIYSLGIVAYEVLCGHPPFRSSTPRGVMAAHITATPLALEKANPSVPRDLASIVMRCIEKDPIDRWQSADDLCEVLNDFGARFTPARKQSAQPSHVNSLKRVETEFSRRQEITAPRAITPFVAYLLLLLIAVLGAGAFFYRRWSATGDDKSLVVLPFNDASAKELAYFTDGMTEDVITNLVQVEGLRVISPSSTFALRNNDSNPATIGRNLRVDYVLEGAVRWEGRKVRINARLVNVKNRSYAWSNSYDRDVVDVTEMQASIAKDISAALALRLAPQSRRDVQKSNRTTLDAYEYFLKGNFAQRGFTEDSLELAISYYDSALAIDPSYARAYAGKASAYYNLADDFWLPSEAYPLVRDNAQKAIALDGKQADAYALLASYELAYGWNWENAGVNARRAVALNRNSSLGHMALSWHDLIMGHDHDAVREAQIVSTLDPYSYTIGGNVVSLMRAAGRNDLAILEARRMLQADVGPPHVLRAWISWDFMLMNNLVGAAAELDSALAIEPSCCKRTKALYQAHAGNAPEALSLLDEIVKSKREAKEYYRADFIAEVNAAAGEREATFASLEQAWRDRSVGLPLLTHNAELRRYALDPRFIALKERLNLP